MEQIQIPPAMISSGNVSLAKYAAGLASSGIRVRRTFRETFWVQYESAAMMRLPKFEIGEPSEDELRELFRDGRIGLASYLLKPDEHHPANAWLYICRDRAYALEKLSPAMRRNVRRGFRELEIRVITSDQLLTEGFPAFCDTRQRTGLRDGTLEEFHRQFGLRATRPGHIFLGAWRGNKLAAFLSIVEVDDWVELGCFSKNDLLNFRPNDALFFFALSHYLSSTKCRLVSYGLSSIQAESNRDSLHVFKTKVGFEAIPVHRAFVLHPLLRPLANRVSLWGVNAVLRCIPGERHLKKLAGVLASILGCEQILDAGKGSNEQ